MCIRDRRQLGLDATVDDRAVARAVAERLRQPADAVDAVLLSAPVTSEAALVRLANDLEAVSYTHLTLPTSDLV